MMQGREKLLREKKNLTDCVPRTDTVLEKYLTSRESARQSYFSSPEQKAPANRTDGVQKGRLLKEMEKVCTAAVYPKAVRL